MCTAKLKPLCASSGRFFDIVSMMSSDDDLLISHVRSFFHSRPERLLYLIFYFEVFRLYRNLSERQKWNLSLTKTWYDGQHCK